MLAIPAAAVEHVGRNPGKTPDLLTWPRICTASVSPNLAVPQFTGADHDVILGTSRRRVPPARKRGRRPVLFVAM